MKMFLKLFGCGVVEVVVGGRDSDGGIDEC